MGCRRPRQPLLPGGWVASGIIVILEEGKFNELPGNRTRFTGRSVFLSVEDRDGMLQSDMEEGMKDSYSRLDELLERMRR